MIPLLPKWHLMPNRPSFYDTDSKTLLELASVLHASMNSLITDYNKFVEAVNNNLTDFTARTEENQKNFEVGLRQEFQEFINIVDLKISGLNHDFEGFTNNVNSSISEQNNKIAGMIANQIPITQNIINDAIKDGTLYIIETYDNETESLNLVVTGDV